MSSDIQSIVNKAKLAGSKLWLILHAQNCKRGISCRLAGCQQAKLLNLHLKTCPVKGANSCCPSGYNGCYQARKLLSHHSKCSRSRRMREAQKKLQQLAISGEKHDNEEVESSSPKQQQQHCLLCSVVSRHAKAELAAMVCCSPIITQQSSMLAPEKPAERKCASQEKIIISQQKSVVHEKVQESSSVMAHENSSSSSSSSSSISQEKKIDEDHAIPLPPPRQVPRRVSLSSNAA